MRKYGKSKTTRIMMATVPHVTSGLGLRKFQADGFLLTRVYKCVPYMLTYSILYRTCTCYNCLSEDEPSGSKQVDVECIVKINIKLV